jgi:hypothetical protein
VVCVKTFNAKEGWRKFTGVETNPFGAEIDWDDSAPEDTDRRNIKCSNCRKRKKYYKVSANNKDTQPFLCDVCGPEVRSARHKAVWDAFRAVQQTGNGRKNESTDNRKQQRVDKKLLNAVDKVSDIWQQVRNYDKKTYEQRLDMISQVDLARELGFKSQDEKNLATLVYKYLKGCGVREMFPTAPSWYRCFVETVVGHIEKKMTSEAVVSSLKSLVTGSSIRGNPHKH